MSLRGAPEEGLVSQLVLRQFRVPDKRASDVGQDWASGAFQNVFPQRPRSLPCIVCPVSSYKQ